MRTLRATWGLRAVGLVVALWGAGPGAEGGVFNVDFGNSSVAGPTQPGFVAFEDAESGGNPAKVQSYATPLGVGGTVTVEVSGYTHFRDYAAITGGPFVGQSALLSDLVLRNAAGVMRLELGNLRPGIYAITTYHHSTQFGGGTFSIRLHDGRALNQTIAAGLTTSSGQTPSSITTQTFVFRPDGSPVAIEFTGGSTPQHLSLDGFELDMVGSDSGMAVFRTPALAVDFNDRGAPGAGSTQAGFSEFLLSGTEGTPIGTPVTRTFGALSVTLSHPNAGTIDDRRRAEPTNAGAFTEQELLRDVLLATGTTASDGLDVLVQGLTPSARYEVTLWAFDDGSAGTRLSDWYANGTLATDNYPFNGDAIPPAPLSNDVYSFTFQAWSDASGALLLAGRAAGGTTPNVFLNALRLTQVTVTPEPTTLSLLALGALAAALRRRRRGGA
jgi:hypothetical protein